MIKMKKIVLCVLLLISVAGHANAAATSFSSAPNKVGLVDMIYVYKNSSTIQTQNDKLAKQNAKIQKLIVTANQEMDKLKNKDPKSIEKKEKEIQAIIDKEVQSFYEEQKLVSAGVQTKIETVLENLARDRSFELILDKNFVTSGGIDITQEFLSKLDAVPVK